MPKLYAGLYVMVMQLSELLVSEALDGGMSGATAFLGILPKSSSSPESCRWWIEIVDITEKIEGFLPLVEALLRDSGAQALMMRDSMAAVDDVKATQFATD